MRRPSAGKVNDVIAERVLRRRDGRTVRLLVGRPRRAKHEWVCRFQVLGVGHARPYDLRGCDSFEALQAAMAMLAVQVDSYQREHGLTLDGGSWLGVFKPDFDAIRKEIEATPDYSKWGPVIEEIWKETARS